MKNQPHTSEYYLGGYADHFTTEVRLYASTCCMSTSIADNILIALCEDPRVAVILQSLQEIVDDELRLVFEVSIFTWRRLCEVTGDKTWEVLHSRCLCTGLPPTWAGLVFGRIGCRSPKGIFPQSCRKTMFPQYTFQYVCYS